MEYSFQRYLLSKQTVDDRALNKDVLAALTAALHPFTSVSPLMSPLKIIEVGAGIGTMLTRLLHWKILPSNIEYTLVDELRENTDYALTWIPSWAKENGYQVEPRDIDSIRISSAAQSVHIHVVASDVFDFIRTSTQKFDLLIAHAFLDLLPMPGSLPKLFSLLKSNGLAWLTLNFDGLTTLEPPSASIRLSVTKSAEDSASLRLSDLPPHGDSESVDKSVDEKIEHLYHRTMDTRPTGGDSHSGRHLFGHLKEAEAEIVSAGASDWVVYPIQGQYPADEAYFLHFILHFFETSLSHHPDLDQNIFAQWLTKRRAQINNAELIYIAHQMDFLCRVPSPFLGRGPGRRPEPVEG